jgi:type VI protein secretion system component Hcp
MGVERKFNWEVSGLKGGDDKISEPLLGWGHDINTSAGGRGTGTAHRMTPGVKSIHVTRATNPNSSKFLQAASAGTSIPKITIFEQTGEGKTTFQKVWVRLTNVFLSNIRFGMHEGQSLENITLVFDKLELGQ